MLSYCNMNYYVQRPMNNNILKNAKTLNFDVLNCHGMN